jgi:hypothetical protein
MREWGRWLLSGVASGAPVMADRAMSSASRASAVTSLVTTVGRPVRSRSGVAKSTSRQPRKVPSRTTDRLATTPPTETAMPSNDGMFPHAEVPPELDTLSASLGTACSSAIDLGPDTFFDIYLFFPIRASHSAPRITKADRS